MAQMRMSDKLWLIALPKQRNLIIRMLRRELKSKYHGSMFGRAWALITPIMSLAVYALVFTAIFPSRWAGSVEEGPWGVIVNLFAGLTTFNLAAESLNSAPNLVLSRSVLATRFIFPLEILSVVSVAAAVVQALVSITILVVTQAILLHSLSQYLLWLPLVWLPLVLLLLAASWILSCIGAFFRDCSQVMSVCTGLLIFLSAVFYPLSSLPAKLRPILQLNPIAMAVEQTRAVVIDQSMPNLTYILIGTVVGLIACEISLRFFQNGRQAFCDVL